MNILTQGIKPTYVAVHAKWTDERIFITSRKPLRYVSISSHGIARARFERAVMRRYRLTNLPTVDFVDTMRLRSPMLAPADYHRSLNPCFYANMQLAGEA